jgi:hypothetical protein
MPIDPKDPPKRGMPSGKPATDPLGVKIQQLGRPATERSRIDPSERRDRRHTKVPPEHIREALGLKPSQPFDDEEVTPVTMIVAVRSELKEDIEVIQQAQANQSAVLAGQNVVLERQSQDIAQLDSSMNSVQRSVATMVGEGQTTNRYLEQMTGMFREVMTARIGVDSKILMTQMEVSQHREMANIDSVADDKKAKRKAFMKVVSAITSGAFVMALLNFLLTRCT